MQSNLKELTRPFSVIHNESQEVRDKFLEGQPWKNNNYPGPFLSALTDKQKDKYMDKQDEAIGNYSIVAETSILDQADKYTNFNNGDTRCESLGASEMPMVKRNSNVYPYKIGNATYRSPNNPYPHDKPPRSIEDFKDMNLTDPCNETGFGDIVPKFKKCSAENNPLLNIENRPISHFSNNNMVPFYGANVTQNMAGTGVPQAGDNNACEHNMDGFSDTSPFRQKLQTFTATDETYMHKRETGRMFSPAEQQDGWVYGSPAFRPNLDNYKQTLNVRNNESPVEKIQVGPGIGLDYSVPAEGGFQQYTRIMPNNISDYKSNELEGRVNAGKWSVNHPTSQFINGVPKNRPTIDFTQARRPTMQTKFYTSASDASSSRLTDYNAIINRGKQTRPEIEASAGFGQLNITPNSSKLPCVTFGKAPVGKLMKSIVPMPTQNHSTFNTIRPTLKRGSAGYSKSKGGYWECDDETPGSNRWGLTLGGPSGSVKSLPTRDGYYVYDTNRGVINPYVINATGNATGAGGLWNPNSYQDTPRVTRKETTQYSYMGNAMGSTTLPTTLQQDTPRVTRKETTQYAFHGNPTGAIKKPKEYTFSDLPRVTRKETTQYSSHGNPAGSINSQTNRQMYTGSYT